MSSEIFKKQSSPFHTPETSSPPITYVDSSSDEEMSTENFFYGDTHAGDWVPGDYLKTVMNTFKEKSTDSFKVMKLETHLASGSAAEEWFDSPAVQAVKVDWSLLEAQFKVRWPKEA
jgi:hypothetical protein